MTIHQFSVSLVIDRPLVLPNHETSARPFSCHDSANTTTISNNDGRCTNTSESDAVATRQFVQEAWAGLCGIRLWPPGGAH